MGEERIVAVGLLTERDLEVLGDTFTRSYRVHGVEGFEDLLAQLDGVEASPWMAANDAKQSDK